MNLIGLLILFFTSILIVAWFIYCKKFNIAIILIVAILLRIFALCFHIFVSPLPESQSDALDFEILAWELSQGGANHILKNFVWFDTYFISWLYSWFYFIFGREALFLYSINIIFGIFTILLCIRFAWLLGGERSAYFAGWVCALHPTLILYSVVTLREVFVTFAVLIAFIGVFKWFKEKKIKYILFSSLGFCFAAFFHGAMIVGLAIFYLLIIIQLLIDLLKSFITGYMNFRWIVLSILGVCIYIFFPGAEGISISKISFLKDELAMETLFNILNWNLEQTVLSSATYPEFMAISSVGDIITKGPLRIIYFLYGPFLWDVKSMSLLIGFFDGLVYLYLSIGTLRNVQFIDSDKKGLTPSLIILLGFIGMFGLAVNNFGLGYRHRAKFLPIFIALYFGTKEMKNYSLNKSKHL